MKMRLIEFLPDVDLCRFDAEKTKNGTFYFSADGAGVDWFAGGLTAASGLLPGDDLLLGGPPEFSARYRNFRVTLERNFERIAEHVPKRCSLSAEQHLLLGTYVTSESLVESATLFIAQE